jgi:hypothetical protein
VTLLCYRDVREGTEQLTGPMHEVVFETVRRFGRGLNGKPAPTAPPGGADSPTIPSSVPGYGSIRRC